MATYEITTEDGSVYQIDTEDVPQPGFFDTVVPSFDDVIYAPGNMVSGLANAPGAIWDWAGDVAESVTGKERGGTGRKLTPDEITNRRIDAISGVRNAALGVVPIPGLRAAGDYLSGNPDNKSAADYGNMVKQDLAALPTMAAAYGVAKQIPTIKNRFNGVNTANQVVNELRDITGNPSLLTTATTDDALAQNIASGIERNAAGVKAAAQQQFQNLGEGSVNISPVIENINQQIASKQGVLAPDSPTMTIANSLNDMVPKAPEPVASGLVDESGVPYPPQEVPFNGDVTLDTGRLQNLLRDVGQGAGRAGSWGGKILNDAKAQLLSEAERQLPPETWQALNGARDSWSNYKSTFEEGAAGAAQDILSNPDKRLDTLYNKLIQDEKSASQIMSVLGDSEKVQAQSLVLQKLLEKNPRLWADHIEKNRGALVAVFDDNTVNELSSWASGDYRGADRLLQPIRRAAGSSVATAPAGVAAGVLLGPKAGAAVQAAGTVLGVLKGKSIVSARNLLKQAAAGNAEAVASINAADLPNQLTQIIGTTGAGLANYLGGSVPADPNPLSRNWEDIKGNQSSLNFFSRVLQSIGLIPSEARAEDLPDAVAKQAVVQAAQMAPMAFQSGPGGYQSVFNGKFYDPMEKDAHISEALDLPPEQRAKIIGAAFQNKYVPPYTTTPPPPPQTAASQFDLNQINDALTLDADYTYNGETTDMLSEFQKMTNAHAQDDLR